MIQKFTENDTKPESMGESSHNKSHKPEEKKTTDLLFYKHLQPYYYQKHDTSLPTLQKETGDLFYSSDMLLNNPHRVETLTML